MRLEARRQQRLIRYEPDDHVVSWSAKVFALANDIQLPDGPGEFIVGRILADELRRYDIAECHEGIWDVADADSSGLEAAWASLLDEQGNFRDDDFDGIADPVVYLYRFVLHPDFAQWRMAVMDAFCATFGSDAIILAQHHTTWFSEAEFGLMGFHILPPTRFPAPAGFPNIDRKTRFMVHDNAYQAKYSMARYPEDAPSGSNAHAEWIESQGPWTEMI